MSTTFTYICQNNRNHQWTNRYESYDEERAEKHICPWCGVEHGHTNPPPARALSICDQLPNLPLTVALQIARLEAEAAASHRRGLAPDPTGAIAAREESEYAHSDEAHQ